MDDLKFRLIDTPPAPQYAGQAAAAQDMVALHQLLFVRLAGLSFNRTVLRLFGRGRGRGRFWHPMPSRWRGALAESGLPVAHFRSAVLWAGYVVALWGYGILTVLRLVIRREGAVPDGPSAIFCGLAPANLPNARSGSHDVMTWYARWKARPKDIAWLGYTGAGQASAHAGEGLEIHGPLNDFEAPLSGRAKLRYLVWGAWAAIRSAADMLVGRWQRAVLFPEHAKTRACQLASADSLGREYLFHNSSFVYRPLWTYAAEARGARILFYFYSTNCETFRLRCGYPRQTGGWELMSWPHYLVWDEYQADFVRRAVGDAAEIETVGSIWFSDAALPAPAAGGPSVAVFDVQPVRSTHYASLALGFDFYVPEVAVPFVRDIAEACADQNVGMLFKRKREIGRLAHPRYRHAVERLAAAKAFEAVDPAISAHRVIGVADAVVSMPFTSTALIGRELGKPSCYYDPLSMLQPDDRAAHGIPIVQGPKALAEWLAAALGAQAEEPAKEINLA